MNPRLEFWKNAFGWPRDTLSYTFLARAVHVVGKSMFGQEWTGKEPFLDIMQSLPKFPVSVGRSAWFAHQLLVERHPEFKRQPLKFPPAGLPLSRPPPRVEFSLEEWDAALAIVANDQKEKLPGVRRFREVRERIIQLAEAGLLVTALREKAGGDPTPVPQSWWNSERITNRFDFCQMNPDDRFGIGSAGDRYQYIFVTTESLISCAPGIIDEQASSSATPVIVAAPAPTAPTETPRPLAKSDIEPEFRKWREQQPEGRIPTEAEDIAHMKQLGVGRDTVRKLRKSFPTRARGEKSRG